MKPGATVSPVASMTRVAAASPRRPMSTIRPPRMPMSAASHGLPLPSRTRPFRIRTSYRAGAASAARSAPSGRAERRAKRMSRIGTASFLLKPGGDGEASAGLAAHCTTDSRRKIVAKSRIRSIVRAKAQLPATESAKIAGLRYVNDTQTPGIRRVGRRNASAMSMPNGKRVSCGRAAGASSRSSSRRPGPTSGSARTRTATCRRPAATRAAASSTAITRGGARCATK